MTPSPSFTDLLGEDGRVVRREVVETVEVGGRVTETLSCGHKLRWHDKGEWMRMRRARDVSERHLRDCYKCPTP